MLTLSNRLERQNGTHGWNLFSDWLDGFGSNWNWKYLEPYVGQRLEGDTLVLEFETPGVKKEDLKVEYEGGGVIKVTYPSYTISKLVIDPNHYDLSKAKASYRDGLLQVRIPKAEDAKSKEILIE